MDKDFGSSKRKNNTIPCWSLSMFPLSAELADPGTSGGVRVTVNGSDPFPVRNFSGISSIKLLQPENIGRTVLLSPLNGDPSQPVITSIEDTFLQDILVTGIRNDADRLMVESLMAGKEVVIEAQHQIVLKCGKGRIIIKSDGRIVIEGTDVLSLSWGPNRLKGSNVELN